MNLATLRTHVARAVGLNTTDATVLQLIDDALNEGIVEFLKGTKIFVIPAALSVTAGEDTYTLDTDILSIQSIWYEPADGSTLSATLEEIGLNDLLQLKLRQAAVDTTPRYFARLGGNAIQLYPAPANSSDQLHITYTPFPASVLSATADTPSATAYGGIPAEFHPAIEAYGKWKMGENEGHRPSQFGAVWKNEFEQRVGLARAHTNRKLGQNRRGITVGRRSVFPVGNGVDIREL